MNRACFFLALGLVTLVTQTQVVGQTRCQNPVDYCRFGIGVDDYCPFTDGYIEVGQTDANDAHAAVETESERDLRGRAVVAVLAVDADFGSDCGYDCDHGRYDSGTRVYPPIEMGADSREDGSPAAAVARGSEATPGLEHRVAAGGCGESDEAVARDPERDFEQECYEAYLARAAQGAESRATEIAAPDAPPADADVGTRHDAYGQGYGYAYDWDFADGFPSGRQLSDPAVRPTPARDPAATAVTGRSVPGGGDTVAEWWSTELPDGPGGAIAAWKARVVASRAAVGLSQLCRETSRVLVSAVRQAMTVGHDWRAANVFLFVFRSDLNAEPLAVRLARAQGAVARPVDATIPPGARAADTALHGDDAVSRVGAPVGQRLEPWVRRAAVAGTEAWERVSLALQRLAQRSLALVASDRVGSVTHR